MQQLIDGVRQVQGVNSVENDLAIDETGQASRLDGEKPKPSGELGHHAAPLVTGDAISREHCRSGFTGFDRVFFFGRLSAGARIVRVAKKTPI